MSDVTTSIEERVAKMPRPAQIYYKQMMSQADGDILTTIKDLREGQIDGSIDLEFRPAANLAMVALTAQVHGSDQSRTKSFAESLHDMRYRIEQARLDGDQESYDALRAGLAQTEAKAKQEEARQAQHIAEMEASNEAFEAQKKTNYETMLASFKDAEMQRIRRMRIKPDEAEAYYTQWSQTAAETAAQRASGYAPDKPPIPITDDEAGIHGAGTG
jgi:hypothetical protein